MRLLFAHPEMLLVAAAAAIPLALHFLRRQRQGEVGWAAMSLLRQIVDQHARRRQLQRRVLLLLRCAAVVLLAIALADPRLESPVLGQGDAPLGRQDLVVVVDVSLSMGAGQDGTTPLDAAKRLAGQAIEGLDPGDTVWVLVLSDALRPLFTEPTVDHRRAIEEVQLLETEDTWADMGPFPEALKSLVSSRLSASRRCRVLIFSDLQQGTWEGLARAQPAQREMEWDIQVVDVGEDRRLDNIRLDRLLPERYLAVAGRPLAFRAELHAWHAVAPRVQLEMLIDQRPVKSLPLEWNAHHRCQVGWRWTFDRPGQYRVTVRVPDDALVGDNAQTVTIQVVPSIPVLCVYGDRTLASLVSHAVAPQEDGPLRPSLESLSSWPWRETGRGEVLVLSDVATLTDQEWRDLRRRVESGTGLVMLLGPSVVPASYNQAGASILPARVLQPVDNVQPGFQIRDPDDPLLLPFAGQGAATLEGTPVWRYWQLELPSESPARVPLVFPNRDPALIWQTVGSGSVAALATSSRIDRLSDPGQAWSALAVWPSFVPLLQQAVWHAAALPYRPTVLQAGRWPDPASGVSVPVAASQEQGGEAPVGRPGSWQYAVSPTGKTPVDIEPADAFPPRHAGWYVRGDDPQRYERLLVVPAAHESPLQRIAAEVIPYPVSRALRPAGRPQRDARGQPAGPTIAPWLLLGTIALLLAEQVLTASPVARRI